MAWITTPDRTTYDWHDVPDDVVPNDREMKAALVSRLNENIFTQDFDIRVDVSDRVVALDGEVDSPVVEQAATDDAWDVPGVVAVDDRLTVAA